MIAAFLCVVCLNTTKETGKKDTITGYFVIFYIIALKVWNNSIIILENDFLFYFLVLSTCYLFLSKFYA